MIYKYSVPMCRLEMTTVQHIKNQFVGMERYDGGWHLRDEVQSSPCTFYLRLLLKEDTGITVMINVTQNKLFSCTLTKAQEGMSPKNATILLRPESAAAVAAMKLEVHKQLCLWDAENACKAAAPQELLVHSVKVAELQRALDAIDHSDAMRRMSQRNDTVPYTALPGTQGYSP
jgi:hypothetical protein